MRVLMIFAIGFVFSTSLKADTWCERAPVEAIQEESGNVLVKSSGHWKRVGPANEDSTKIRVAQILTAMSAGKQIRFKFNGTYSNCEKSDYGTRIKGLNVQN